MSHSIYTAVIDLGYHEEPNRRSIEEKINTAIFDVLDEILGIDYHVLTSMVIDADDDELLPPPQHDQLGPFTRDSDTSRKAAIDNYPRSGSQRWRVLMAIAQAGQYGHTRDELAKGLGLPDSGTDARVWELLQGKFIEETDRTRKTQHGSEASVLVLSDRGRRYLDVKEGTVV